MSSTKKCRPLIPFRFLPGSWGLSGDAYDEAEAFYSLDGEDLERRLAAIRLKDDRQALSLALLAIDRKYERIDNYTYERSVALIKFEEPELTLENIKIDAAFHKITQYEAEKQIAELSHTDEDARALALLDIDVKFGKIEKNAYEKQKATLKKEPWIGIINSGFDPENGIDGVYFEFDWNTYWIDYLKLHGYVGHTDEQIVDDWFSDVCRSYGTAELATLPMIPVNGTED